MQPASLTAQAHYLLIALVLQGQSGLVRLGQFELGLVSRRQALCNCMPRPQTVLLHTRASSWRRRCACMEQARHDGC